MRVCTCSNCGAKGSLASMVSVTACNKTVARLCLQCQQAKKIQITLEKTKEGDWAFAQYFPVEA